MSGIKYASIINAWVSTEGSNGYMTNYIYYSVLVAYEDGTKDILEGRSNDIKWLMSYVRTPMDYLQEVCSSILRLQGALEQRTQSIIDAVLPIPDITDMNEDEAIIILQQAGLIPIMKFDYPTGTPHNGVVYSFKRNEINVREVEIEVVHVTPQVVNMEAEEAVNILKNAGFRVECVYRSVKEKKDSIVLSVVRPDIHDLNILLIINANKVTIGMELEDAKQLFMSKGFGIRLKGILSPQRENTIIEWRNISENLVELIYSINLDSNNLNIKGMMLEDARRLLMSKGFGIRLKGIPSSQNENTIIDWKSISEYIIELTYSTGINK